jgi:hypothetical protein
MMFLISWGRMYKADRPSEAYAIQFPWVERARSLTVSPQLIDARGSTIYLHQKLVLFDSLAAGQSLRTRPVTPATNIVVKNHPAKMWSQKYQRRCSRKLGVN